MDSAAIEQMNKLRKSLGLPLLGGARADSNGPTFKEKKNGDASDDEPASTIDTREAAGYANFKQIQDDEKKRLEREQRKKALQKARDAAARFQRLEGKGLGDVDEAEDVDAKAWLKGQKKRQNQIEQQRARRLEEELAEREKLAAIEYKSSDLAGVQVAHEIGDFDDGAEDQILTLKDQEIGKDDEDEDGDVLENADLIARDKLKEKMDAKKKIRYDIHDEEKQDLLSQYDEKKRKAFTLDAQGSSLEERESKRQAIGEKLKNTISLDSIIKPEIMSDYQEIKIKKPKKTSKKNKRQKEADEDDIYPTTNGTSDVMEVDAPKPRSRAETNYNDDEDLSNALSFSRRAALKKKKLKPEDLVKQLKEEELETEIPEAEGGIVLDDTTTFLDNLQSRPQDEEIKPAQKSAEALQEEEQKAAAEDEDQLMQDTNEAYTIVEGDEQALLDSIARNTPAEAANPELSRTGLEEEQTLSGGLGSTLALLRSRGLVQENDISDKNTLYRDRQRFINEQRLREHQSDERARQQRERDRLSGKNTGMSQRDREEKARWENERRSQQQSVAAAAAFNKEYKPDVNLKYVDDSGRLLNQKEAFKHLSHQFHGKGSGKGKTEKHLKKIDEEKRDLAKSVLDSSSIDRGMQRAQGTMGKRDKVAGVRLG
ncbi:hypothetical protein PMZ80_003914 [Knufia obscura]|uniref:Uncharacterized protein n=2 Tax=Knufia TaxID=430999 RepID=A0AAN8I7G3_9EURO|nr:hypothetical protein PMZ80_003914 [Knufia obscura]KAK5958172.1 hypothetical protein OHC33_000013 [Knufia fluminis]